MIDKLTSLDALPAWLDKGTGSVQFEFDHVADYLEDTETRKLHVLLDKFNGERRCLITETLPELLTSFDAASEALSLKPINLDRPLSLEPVYIPKPWGQEIWYSGIEARGVSTCNGVPISWILDIFGDLLGCAHPPLLLKILDPLPEENLGDLYFELHEKKTEVYIVTHVDREAWPDGIGQIRYGFNQELMGQYASRDAFLVDYREAVRRYEEVRRNIDGGARGLDEDEVSFRQAMYQFTSVRNIREGDVIKVENFVPHSLQHGVRVIEFQTAHYERYILSFGQEVVTQDHWDTDAALELANTEIDSFSTNPDDMLIADFNEFAVRRLSIDSGVTIELESDRYQLLIAVNGILELDSSATMHAESAWLLPQRTTSKLRNSSGEPATIIIANEKIA